MKQEIFDLTEGGRRVFEYYIPYVPDNIKKKFSIRDEKTPSASIKLVSNPKGSHWILKDFGTNERAINAIDYVMLTYDLTFIGACKKIVQDMGLPIDVDLNQLHDWKNPEFPNKYDIPTELEKSLWAKRKISPNVVKQAGLFMQPKFIVEANRELQCLVFPYYEEGVIVNAKNRGKYDKDGKEKKCYQLEKGGKRVFYNLDSVKNDTDICILVEGEFDALSVLQALTYQDAFNKETPNNTLKHKKISVISVSNGVNSLNDNLALCLDKIKHIREWIVFVDADTGGKSLEDEFTRRIGKRKCRIAKKNGYKDANELLTNKGEMAVLSVLSESVFCKIEGLITLKDYEHDLDHIFRNGMPQGLKLGFENGRSGEGFDEYFSLLTKTVGVVTGVPMTGKSTFADTIAILMAKQHNWKTAYFSPEFPDTATHASRIINTLTGKRFRKSPTDVGHDVIDEYTYFEAKEFVNQHFYHYETPVDEKERLVEVTTDMIYDFMEDMVMRHGVKLFIIDPLNKVGNESKFGDGGLAKFMNKFFNELNYFKKYLDVCVIVVAHPTKIEKKRKLVYNTVDGDEETVWWYNPISPYEIFGGSEIYNQVDFILSMYRYPINYPEYPDSYTEVHIQKMKLDYLGKLGVSPFEYDITKRQYSCLDSSELKQYEMNPLSQSESHLGLVDEDTGEVFDNIYFSSEAPPF